MIAPAMAELPVLKDDKWIGFFQGFETRSMRFGVAGDGKIIFKLIGKKSDPLGQKLMVDVGIRVEETMPDGKVVAKALIPGSLESAQLASDRPKNVVIRGKVTGDAEFELTVNEERGAIQLGGRMLGAGTLKNPLRFALQVRIPNAYPDEQSAGDRKKEKAFEDRTKGDRVQFTLLDGKRIKSSRAEVVDSGAAQFKGAEIAKAQIQFDSYQGKEIEVEATGNSSFQLDNPRTGPLRDGFTLTWASDPAKDPEAKARLVLGAK